MGVSCRSSHIPLLYLLLRYVLRKVSLPQTYVSLWIGGRLPVIDGYRAVSSSSKQVEWIVGEGSSGYSIITFPE